MHMFYTGAKCATHVPHVKVVCVEETCYQTNCIIMILLFKHFHYAHRKPCGTYPVELTLCLINDVTSSLLSVNFPYLSFICSDMYIANEIVQNIYAKCKKIPSEHLIKVDYTVYRIMYIYSFKKFNLFVSL